MTYTIIYQSIDQVKMTFVKCRHYLDPTKDSIMVIWSASEPPRSSASIYGALLQLEGRYRSSSRQWLLPALKIRVLSAAEWAGRRLSNGLHDRSH